MSAKVILLVVSIVMPQNVPDIRHMEKMESLDTCWAAAKDYMEQKELTDEMRNRGALGLSASCGFMELPSSRN